MLTVYTYEIMVDGTYDGGPLTMLSKNLLEIVFFIVPNKCGRATTCKPDDDDEVVDSGEYDDTSGLLSHMASSS